MFPVHVDFHPDELLVSYASRLARANGLLGINDLFRDFEIAPQAFHLGESRAINLFAEVTGIDPAMALAQSFVAMPNDSYRIAAQTIGDRYLLRRQFRVCPACLRNDIGTELTSGTVFRAYARISWSLTTIQCCPVHHLLLVLPPEPGTSYDFCHGWEPWLPEVYEGDFDKPTGATGKYEAYARASFAGEGSSRPGYLADLPLDAAGAAAEALGLSALHGAKWSKSDMSAEELSLATDAGFDLLARGHDGVQSLLDDLRFAEGKPQERPPGRYGKLHEWLLRGGGSAETFAPLQEHLARHITDTWPLGPGDLCFRTKVTTRCFHSILTAAAQYGLRPAQVQDLLQGAGLQGALPLPEYEQVYEAMAVEQVLEAVSSSISMQAAMVKLGLTRNQMTTLIDAGYLTVSKGGDRSRPRFSPADISAFLDRHRNIPVEPSRGTGGDTVSILVAARRFGVSTAQIYGLFLEGKLSRVSRAKDDLLWSSLRVSAFEVGNHLSTNTGKDQVRLSTAAVSLGLSNDFLRRLGAEGWFELRREVDPRTRQRVTTLAEREVADFEARYITRRRLAQKMLLDVRQVQQHLGDAGSLPVHLSDDGRELIFNLEDCRPFLPDP